jgi:uncharacterized protein (UPF0212 family)
MIGSELRRQEWNPGCRASVGDLMRPGDARRSVAHESAEGGSYKMLQGLRLDEQAGMSECPKCQKTIDRSAQKCPFCSTRIDPGAAVERALAQARINDSCYDADQVFHLDREVFNAFALGGLLALPSQ